MRHAGDSAAQRRTQSTGRRASIPAAVAIIAIGLFGAVPAWATVEAPGDATAPAQQADPAAAPARLSLRAEDAQNVLQPGVVFEVRAAQGAEAGQTPVTALLLDNAGQPDYVGADLDPTPGAFTVDTLTDAADPARSHTVMPGEVLQLRVTQTASGKTPDAEWQDVTVQATEDDPIHVITVPVPETPAPEVPAEEELTPVAPVAPAAEPDSKADTSAAPLAAAAAPTARIIVKTGGDRTGTTGVTPLAGVRLMLNGGGSSGPNGARPDGVSGDGAGWAMCVSDSNGECTFEVPNTRSGEANRDRRFWVVPAPNSAPSGWFANTSLRTGSTGSGNATSYAYRIGSLLRADQVYISGSAFMTTGSDYAARNSSGTWGVSRNNPALAQSCGIDVALVLDRSGSVGSAGMEQLKNAANAFVNALVGTQSRMAVFSFAGNSPESGAPNHPNLTSVATQSQANAFKSRYAGLQSDGGTNWDRGIAVAAEASQGTNRFDVTVVITDGNPTFAGPNATGPGNRTQLREVENGIFSANALKNTGSRVIAFGVGDGIGSGTAAANSALNLRAISGPTKGVDYFQTSDYDSVGKTLRNLALGNCAGQLNVTKMIVPETAPEGSTAGAVTAGEGWEFTASQPSAGVILPNPPVRVTEADETGTVAFPLTFAGDTTRGEVTITETQQPGYVLQPVNGQNAVCVNLVTNAKVTPSGNPTNGFRVAVPNGETVNCTVYNRAPNKTATVQVDKVWKIQDPAGTNLGTYRIPSANASELPVGMSGQLTLTGPTGNDASPQDWGVPREGYVAGKSAGIDETVNIDTALLPGCSLTSSTLSKRGTANASDPLPASATLTPGANTFEITNVVTCESQLTLLKSVEGGSASPANWDLIADPSSDGEVFTVSGDDSRSAANTFGVSSTETYALSETQRDKTAPLAYLLDRVERCDPTPGTPGECTWVPVDETAPVSVGLGQHDTYRFVNRAVPALEVPLTGGLSSDALGIAGASLAGLALLVGAVTWTRRKRSEPSA